MVKRKTIRTVLWVIIILIAITAITSLVILPQWKGVFIAGTGGFLILNLFLILFFLRKNYKQ
jgi:uncharacterized membrane protein